MRYSIDSAVLSMFPDLARGVVVAHDIDNRLGNGALAALLEDTWRKTQSSTATGFAEDARVKVWDDAYRRFGANPNRDTPSIKFLLSQALKGKSLRSINPLVDILNIISLRYSLPCGADDINSLDVNGDIALALSKGDETFTSLGKPEQADPPVLGEVIYLTLPSKRVMCRRWNWRNAFFSRITNQTKLAAINVDAFLPPFDMGTVRKATEELANLVTEFCGGRVEQHYLNASNPWFEM